MAVRKIKTSWWVDLRFEGERYRKRSPENSRAGAIAYEAFLRRQLVKGEPIEKKQSAKKIPIFCAYSKEWLNTYVISNNKLSEQLRKEAILRLHLNPFFGKTPVNKITTHQIEKYKATKIEKYNPKTINNQLAVLSRCLRSAYEDDDLKIESRFPKIKLKKLIPPPYNYLSIEECSQLLKYADGVWKTMILVVIKTGLRLGELLALDWSDINLNNKTMTVRRSKFQNIVGSTKSHKIRIVSLTDDVVSVLSDHNHKIGFVFSDENGEALIDHKVKRNLSRICKKAGLRKTGWHALRHTFASHLAEAGVSMQIIQELLGHSDIRTTKRYAHLSPHAFESAVNVLSLPNFNDIFGQQAVNQS